MPIAASKHVESQVMNYSNGGDVKQQARDSELPSFKSDATTLKAQEGREYLA